MRPKNPGSGASRATWTSRNQKLERETLHKILVAHNLVLDVVYGCADCLCCNANLLLWRPVRTLIEKGWRMAMNRDIAAAGEISLHTMLSMLTSSDNAGKRFLSVSIYALAL